MLLLPFISLEISSVGTLLDRLHAVGFHQGPTGLDKGILQDRDLGGFLGDEGKPTPQRVTGEKTTYQSPQQPRA